MEFARRTYRRLGCGCTKAISIESADGGDNVRITLSQERHPLLNNDAISIVSIDLPKNIARAIRDHLNEYLSE